jgi:hypothetical protein
MKPQPSSVQSCFCAAVLFVGSVFFSRNSISLAHVSTGSDGGFACLAKKAAAKSSGSVLLDVT